MTPHTLARPTCREPLKAACFGSVKPHRTTHEGSVQNSHKSSIASSPIPSQNGQNQQMLPEQWPFPRVAIVTNLNSDTY